MLNFTEAETTLAEMRRVARSPVAACVWDYGGGMELLRTSWAAAAELGPAAARLDEVRRLGDHCRPEALSAAFAAGLRRVEVGPIEVVMRFHDLDDG